MQIRCDVLIIGDGQAATPLALALAKRGRQVAVAERQQLGGSCVNFGCTPTKAAIASARLAQQIRRAHDLGIRADRPEVDFPAVLERARRIRDGMRGSLAGALGTGDNPRLIHGHARFAGRTNDGFRVQVAEDEVVAGQVVIDTGTRSLVPPIDGLDEVDFLDAGNWLDGKELPRQLAILGGGYIGLEMAQLYQRLGSAVTVIEAGDRIADQEDADVSAALQDMLEQEGVTFRRQCKLNGVRRHNGTIDLAVGNGVTLSATQIFVATGRRPNTDDLGLETVGVATDDKGFLEVDERLRTSVDGIWAAGDIRGGPMFTHSSWDDNRVLQSQLMGDGSDTTLRTVPYAIFTDPQLGRVGMTEAEAREAGLACKIGRFEMRRNGKAKEIGEEAGFIKVVVDADEDLLLGAAVLAAEGAEIVHSYAGLISARLPIDAMRDALFIHPTLAEATQSALGCLEG
jgi:pyruvate/2-oxoglutarate dehydrogenase complex dihydrolipoamide dehydrogenase (E3) component